jgi:hypothetical protein
MTEKKAASTPQVTKIQIDYLVGRMRKVYNPRYGAELPVPPDVQAAKKIVAAYNTKTQKLQEERETKWRKEMAQVEEDIRFLPGEVALEKVKAFEAKWTPPAAPKAKKR